MLTRLCLKNSNLVKRLISVRKLKKLHLGKLIMGNQDNLSQWTSINYFLLSTKIVTCLFFHEDYLSNVTAEKAVTLKVHWATV